MFELTKDQPPISSETALQLQPDITGLLELTRIRCLQLVDPIISVIVILRHVISHALTLQ